MAERRVEPTIQKNLDKRPSTVYNKIRNLSINAILMNCKIVKSTGGLRVRMIYRKKVSLVSIFAFFLVILVITGSVLNSKISLKHFFDDWKPQSDVQVLTVVDDTALHYGNTVSHLDLSQGIVEEI